MMRLPHEPRRGPTVLALTVPPCFGMLCADTLFSWRARSTPRPGPPTRSTKASSLWPRSRIGDQPRTGPIGPMRRGDVWFAATPGGDRPVLVLTRDPVADRIGSVVVAALTRTKRDLVSELQLTASTDGVPTDCVVNFDNLHTLPRDVFRRRVAELSPKRLGQA